MKGEESERRRVRGGKGKGSTIYLARTTLARGD